MKKEKTQSTEKLSFGERFSYSLGSLACNLIWTSISSFMVLFYTDIALIPAATVGIMILLSRIFDGFSDIGMGVIVDRTKTPQGKARPWLLRMAIPFGICAVLCFTAPDWNLTGKIIYAFITYNLMTTIAYTGVDMPYGVLNATLSSDQYERSVLNIFRLFMAIVAGLVVNFTVLPLVNAFGGGARGWQMTFVILGSLSSIFFLITYFKSKERVVSGPEEKDDVPVKLGLKALFSNKYWVMLCVYAFLSYTASGLSSAVNVYYCRDILGNATLVGTLTAFGVLPMIAGTFVLAPLIKKFGKRNTALFGIFSGILGSVIMIFAGSNLAIIFVSMVFKSFGSACIIGTLFAMISDTIVYGEWKSGIRTEGLSFSAASFGNKLGSGFGAAILGISLSIGGYVAEAGSQPAGTLTTIKLLFLGAPILFLAGMGAILFFYKLDKDYPSIMAELKARKGGAVIDES